MSDFDFSPQDSRGDEFILVPAKDSQYTTFSHVLADVEANNREILGGPDIRTVSPAASTTVIWADLFRLIEGVEFAFI